MHHNLSNPRWSTEEFLGELTDAAYRVALRHEFQGSFIQVQLDLWTALRKVLGKWVDVTDIPQFSSAGAKEDEEEAPGREDQADPRWQDPESATCTA